MKKRMVILGVLMLAVTMLTGCLPLMVREELQESLVEEEKFTVDGYGITITTPGNWEKEEDTSFDIQLHDGQAYFGVMAYRLIDLPEGGVPKDYYDWHNEDIFSRRENLKVIEEAVTESCNGKTITRAVYSAERDGNKNYYYSCLVTFDDSDVFAWVIVTAVPSEFENRREEYAAMIEAMEVSD